MDRPCVMCGEPARAANSVCSRDCLLAARRELDGNVAEVRRHDGIDEAAREVLVARNGVLSNAMISWSP